MADVDEIIDVEEVEEVEEVEVVEDAEPEKIEEIVMEEAISDMPLEKHTPPSNIQLTELEYSALSKTFTTITRLKETLNEKPHEETQDQINFLEVSIWDDIVKRFGFNSVESAQSNGFTFNIKAVHVVECKQREQ